MKTIYPPEKLGFLQWLEYIKQQVKEFKNKEK